MKNNTFSVPGIGLFAIGLDTYWPQFDGLKDRLEGYLKIVESKLSALHPNIVNAGLVDNTDKAFAAGKNLARKMSVSSFYMLVRMLCHQRHCRLFKGLKCL